MQATDKDDVFDDGTEGAVGDGKLRPLLVHARTYTTLTCMYVVLQT